MAIVLKIKIKKSCQCFYGLSGENCEIELNSRKITKGVQWTSTVICMIFIAYVYTMIIGTDVLSFFKIGHKRIDLAAWKHEKLYGKKATQN